MTTPIMKPLKAFRVSEPLPAKTEAEIPLYTPPESRTSKAPRPTFAELYGGPAPKPSASLKHTVGRTILPRSSYRTTHDHSARTTTLIQMIEDHEVKRFPAVPGILSLRKALAVNNIFSRKHPLVRNT